MLDAVALKLGVDTSSSSTLEREEEPLRPMTSLSKGRRRAAVVGALVEEAADRTRLSAASTSTARLLLQGGDAAAELSLLCAAEGEVCTELRPFSVSSYTQQLCSGVSWPEKPPAIASPPFTMTAELGMFTCCCRVLASLRSK